jgi:hypothetical protein
MEIKGESYTVTYDPDTTTIICEGSFRLRGTEEYAPIVKMLDDVADEQPSTITLNLRELQFLNSSGINTLSKFVIKLRKQKTTSLIIQGSHEYPWQAKSLKNLKRLLPTLELELE